MAAVIQIPSQSTTRLAAPVAEFFALAQPALDALPEPRPQLRVIEGGRAAALRVRRPIAVYRRRRLTAVLFSAVVVLTAVTVGWSVDPAATTAGLAAGVEAVEAPVRADGPVRASTAPAEVHVVQPGETLWSIARSIADGGDIRMVVDQLADAAGSSTLQAGQRLDLAGIAGG